MSTDVAVYDEEGFRQAIDDVRSDSTDTNWALFGHYEGNPNEIYTIAKGNEGPNGAVSYMDDTQYMYGLFRVEQTIDMSQTVKFVYVKLAGKDVAFVKKGKYGVVQGAIDGLFSPYHLVIEVDTADEITSEVIDTKLEETSGTKNKVLDVSEAKIRPERGFTSGTTTKADPTGSTPTKSAKLVEIGRGGSSFKGFSGMAKGSGLKILDEVTDAIEDVKSDTTLTNWCVAGYEDNNWKKPVKLLGSGEESNVEEVKKFCSDDNIVFGYMRLTDIVDDIPTVKFVYIQWVGEATKIMTKAKVSTHKGSLEDAFKPAHVTIFATAPGELNQRQLIDKVSSASGSKKSHVK